MNDGKRQESAKVMPCMEAVMRRDPEPKNTSESDIAGDDRRNTGSLYTKIGTARWILYILINVKDVTRLKGHSSHV